MRCSMQIMFSLFGAFDCSLWFVWRCTICVVLALLLLLSVVCWPKIIFPAFCPCVRTLLRQWREHYCVAGNLRTSIVTFESVRSFRSVIAAAAARKEREKTAKQPTIHQNLVTQPNATIKRKECENNTVAWMIPNNYRWFSVVAPCTRATSARVWVSIYKCVNV